MKKLLIAALIFTAFASCNKDKESSSDSTKVFFYTTAQMILNCGPFGVDVYVDDNLQLDLEESEINCGYDSVTQTKGNITYIRHTTPYPDYDKNRVIKRFCKRSVWQQPTTFNSRSTFG